MFWPLTIALWYRFLLSIICFIILVYLIQEAVTQCLLNYSNFSFKNQRVFSLWCANRIRINSSKRHFYDWLVKPNFVFFSENNQFCKEFLLLKNLPISVNDLVQFKSWSEICSNISKYNSKILRFHQPKKNLEIQKKQRS